MSLEKIYPLMQTHKNQANKFIKELKNLGFTVNHFKESGNIKFASLTRGNIGVYLEVGNDRYINRDKKEK